MIVLPSLPQWRRVLVWVLSAGAANCIGIPVLFGAKLFIGWLLVMPLVLALSAPWALVAALAAAVPIVALSGQPFLFVLIGLEACWLVTIGRRLRSMALAELLYWAILGVPLGAWLYSRGGGVPVDSAAILLASHALNGFTAVLLAEFLIHSTPVAGWLGAVPAGAYSLRSAIFNLVFALAALPLVAMTLGTSLLLLRSMQSRAQAELDRAIAELGQQLVTRVRDYREAVLVTARVLEHSGIPSVSLMDEIRRAHPAFITMLIASREGRIIETSPHDDRLTGADVSDRPYFLGARNRDRPVTSGVFRGRGFGHDILIAVSAPFHAADGTVAGVVEGSIEVTRLGASLDRTGVPANTTIVLIDAGGHVVFADHGSGLAALDRANASTLTPVIAAAGNGSAAVIDLPGSDGKLQRLYGRAGRFDFGFSVVALRPALIGVDQLMAVCLLLCVALTAAMSGTFWLARVASRRLAKPLEIFAHDAVGQAESGAISEMVPPRTPVPQEVTMVFTAFNILVTRMRAIHQALIRANADLDARVAERTRELKAAQERAEAANRSKTEFVAMTGHEIRNPLNAMIGLAEAAAAGVPPGPAADRLATIQRSTRHLLGVVNDLLDLSRVEAGKLELRPGPTEIGAMAREVVALFEMQARKQGLELKVVTNIALPLWLEADAPRLEQVLINLIGNGLKFTREGGVRLLVDQEHETEAGVTVRFSVCDTGLGIRPDEVARLFEPYVQLSGGQAGTEAGSGLGLAISRRVVELLGGRLAVRTEPGRGSDFHFSVTFRRSEPRANAPANGNDAEFRALRVLVADDNAANQEVLRAFLERSCATFETVDNAQDALARLDAAIFDVALIDLEMPGESGDVVARAFTARREQLSSRDCALIAVSAHTPDEKREECLQAGFSEFLAKPIDRRELMQVLERFVKQQQFAAGGEIPDSVVPC